MFMLPFYEEPRFKAITDAEVKAAGAALVAAEAGAILASQSAADTAQVAHHAVEPFIAGFVGAEPDYSNGQPLETVAPTYTPSDTPPKIEAADMGIALSIPLVAAAGAVALTSKIRRYRYDRSY